MSHVALTTHYEAPIDRVFAFATDFKSYPTWSVNYIKVDEVTGPVDKVGTKIHGVLKVLGREFVGWGEILEVEAPKLLRFRSKTQEGWTEALYRFTPEGTGTKAEYEFTYELKPGLFGAIADKLFIERSVERDLRHSMENSKAFVEQKVPVLV